MHKSFKPFCVVKILQELTRLPMVVGEDEKEGDDNEIRDERETEKGEDGEEISEEIEESASNEDRDQDESVRKEEEDKSNEKNDENTLVSSYYYPQFTYFLMTRPCQTFELSNKFDMIFHQIVFRSATAANRWQFV